jgi:ABC-type phosphate/phosphonate transport system substrate-binding protein
MMHAPTNRILPGTPPAFPSAGCFLIALLLLKVAGLPLRAADNTGTNDLEPIRFAFSSSMFTDVNENDAKASVKAWGLALARERGVPMSTEPILLSGTARLEQALRTAAIDGAAVTTAEYLSLPSELQGTNLFLSSIGGKFTEEYLLLVHTGSSLSNLAGLQGHTVILFDNPRASLAPLWLDLILSQQGLGLATDYFGQISKAHKLAQVVLPVFFHQRDACVVTRRGFDTMCELNPQVRVQLRVLATSPALVPALGFIRRGYNSPLRKTLFSALQGLENSPAGTQVLTLFQSDQLHEEPVTLLDSARELVDARRRLDLVAVGGAGRTGSPEHSPDTHRDP